MRLVRSRSWSAQVAAEPIDSSTTPIAGGGGST
jgi:hypothetical protein